MGFYLLHSARLKSASVNKRPSKTIVETWALDSYGDVDAFLASLKKKGDIAIYYSGSGDSAVSHWYEVESVDVERRPSTNSGAIQLLVTTSLKSFYQGYELTAPWNLPAYNYRLSAASQEESTSTFYPGVGDLIFPDGSYDEQPFVNTAGVQIEGRTTRGLVQVDFTYRVDYNLDVNDVWLYKDAINDDSVTVCGVQYPPRVLRLENYDATLSTTKVLSANKLRIYFHYFVDRDRSRRRRRKG